MSLKNGKNLNCLVCGTSFYVSRHQVKCGSKFCSLVCYHKSTRGKPMHPNTKKSLTGIIPWNKGLKGHLAGDKHPNWQGGIQSQNTKIRRSLEYRSWVLEIFRKDSFTCQFCKEKEKVSGRLVADHIRPFSLFPQLRFDIQNGQTLCVDCHKIKTRGDWKLIKSYRKTQDASYFI